jgi:hypothetical protein
MLASRGNWNAEPAEYRYGTRRLRRARRVIGAQHTRTERMRPSEIS